MEMPETPDQLVAGYRECVNDVLALSSAQRLILEGGPDQILQGIENFSVLMQHADLVGCLQTAVAMLTNSWTVIASARAKALGSSPEAELEALIAEIRRQVAELGSD